MKIKVLYEDKDILAIDKPSGILTHSDGRSEEETLIDFVRKDYPTSEVVHRLDKETSGVLLVAKNEKAHEFLKKQFMDREVKKIYLAVVSGWVKNERGVINKAIGRSPRDFRRYSAGRGARGEMREAETFYKVLERIEAPQKFTLLEVRPKTGRTHQIRVHMKYLNHPVVGDDLYNPKEKNWPRMMLHARSIEFQNMRGENVKIESTLPKEFEQFT